MKSLLSAILVVCISLSAWAEKTEKPFQGPVRMTNAHMDKVIRGIVKEPGGRPGHWNFMLDKFQVTIITDENADRMRIIVPVAKMTDLNEKSYLRLMQANFDSALDARYSVAQGVLWSAYIHPLSVLSDQQLIDGLAQTVNLAATYGSTYSSGALTFGGGDSQQEQNKYYREIIERSDSI